MTPGPGEYVIPCLNGKGLYFLSKHCNSKAQIWNTQKKLV